MLQVITYHALAVGFIALSLKVVNKERAKSKEMGRDSVKGGIIIIGSYLLQALIGVTVTMLLSLVFTTIVPYAGIILPLGFGQGPGQAMTWGSTYEALGFAGGTDFGITISTMGFLSAAVGGVIYLNYAAKKGFVKRRDENENAPQSDEMIKNKANSTL
jgi:ESS family glutamate:Na+ symporter